MLVCLLLLHIFLSFISDAFFDCIAFVFGFSTKAEPGQIQHIFSFSLSVRGESTVKLAGIVLEFVVNKKEREQCSRTTSKE